MLRQMRSAEKIKKVLWIGLLLVIIPSFVAFYGWNTYSSTPGETQAGPAAEIDYGLFDEREVTLQDLQDAEQSLKTRLMVYSQTYNIPLDQASLGRVVENKDLVDEAVNLVLLKEYAEENGLMVSSEEAMEAIQRQVPPEQRAMLDAQLKQAGMSPAQYIEGVRQDLLRSKVVQTVGSNVRVTHYEAWLDYLVRNERLLADFVRLDASDFITSVTIDDAGLNRYFEENAQRFRVPEQVQYAYVLVRKDDLKTSIAVTNDEITSYYNDRREDFRLPRTAELRQIMVKKPTMRDLTSPTVEALTSATEQARSKATDIYERIAKGEDFASLANQFNEETRTVPREDNQTTATDAQTTAGGYLGRVSEAKMKAFYGDEWTSTVFNLEPGDVSRPIATTRGFFIVKMENKNEGVIQPLEQVRDVIVERIRTEKVNPVFEEMGQRLQQAADTNTGLQSLADLTSQTVKTTPKVTRDADFIPNLGLLGEFVDAVRDLQKGGRSEVLSDNQRHLVMEVVEEFPAHKPELKDVRDQVVQAYRGVKAQEMARSAAQDIRKRATDLPSLQKAALDYNTTVTRSRPFTRTEATTVLGPVQNFMEASAGMKKGDIALHTLGQENEAQGYVVWHLSEKTEPPRTDFAKDLGKITQELLQKKQELVIMEFLREQRRELAGDIKIHPAYQ